MRQTFRALRHRNFRLFWTGQLFSLIGTWMQSVAQQWLVYQLTGAPLALGAVMVAQNLPVLLLSLFAGVVVDRVPKRHALVATQACAALLAGVLAALTISGLVQYWHVLVLAALLGVVNAFDMPTRLAFVIEMVEGNQDDLLNAVALNSSIFNAARAIGPAVAGTLVGLVGEGWAFLINAISFVPVIAGLLMMRLPPFSPPRRRGSTLSQLRDGLVYVARNPLIRSLMLLVAVPSVFGMSFVALLPIVADQILVVPGDGPLSAGATRLGLLMAANGCGALAGALVLATRGRTDRRDRPLLVGSLAFAASLLSLAFVRNFFVALPVLFVTGMSMIAFLATCNTLIQTACPNELRGRVMSLYTVILIGLAPVGGVFMGTVAQLTSTPAAVGLGGAVCLASATVILTRTPTLRLAARSSVPVTV